MDFEKVAKQLAYPQGEFGIEVGNAMNSLNEFISKQTYDLLQINSADSVLEIGLGNGKFVDYILGKGMNVYYTGIDISETMLTEARSLNAEQIKTGYVDLIEAGIEEMPFWEGTFQKVCSVNTIYFWDNPLNAFNEVYRVLANSGYFVLSFRPFIEGKSLDFSEYGFKEYKEEDVQHLIEKTNFRIIEKRHVDEDEIEFNGQMHDLNSFYFVLQKVV